MQPVSSDVPTEAKFQVSPLSRVVVGWVSRCGEIEIKAKLSPAKAGAWAELGNRKGLSGIGSENLGELKIIRELLVSVRDNSG